MLDKTATRKAWTLAREKAANGGEPKNLLASNQKTGFSLFDNLPDITCSATCPVAEACYDRRLLNFRPNVMTARADRHYLLLSDPILYVEKAVREIEKKRKRPERVRIYAGGDYHPRHLEAIGTLCKRLPNVTFYMISKTISRFPEHAAQLLLNRNFFLNMSEMAAYRFKGEAWDTLRQHARVNTVYTLLPNETDFSLALQADIVFNVSRKAADIARYQKAGLALCPCDAKLIPSKGACEACGLCSTKGGVRGG